MADTAYFLGYKRIKPPLDGFNTLATNEREARSQAFMEADLAASGLTFEETHCSPSFFQKDGLVQASYDIPFCDLQGRPLITSEGVLAMYRTRINWSAAAVGRGKYTQPSKDKVGVFATMPFNPWGQDLTGGGETLYICEGEKKTWCVKKFLEVDALGICGKDNWRSERDGEVVLHPDLETAVMGFEKIVVVPDGDIHRWDISKSYGFLCDLLKQAGKDVRLLDMPDKVDDLIVRDGVDAFWEVGEVDPSRVVQEPKWLINEYSLTATGGDKAKRIEIQEDNVIQLLENHPGAPEIWLDIDHNKVMFDDVVAEGPEYTALYRWFLRGLTMTKLTRNMFNTAVYAVAEAHARSPWRDWLDGLQWDKTRRLATLFTDYCKAPKGRDAYHAMVATRWLVGACERAHNAGAAMDYMLISRGGQGIGKSWFPKILFGKEHVVEIVGKEGQQKDELVKFHMGLCISFEELAGMNKKDLDQLKATITTQEDVFRPPYGTQTQHWKRRSVLYGSTNDAAPLKRDSSGYRRWCVVDFSGVQFEALERDREQLWAEAMALWRAGDVPWWQTDMDLMGHIEEEYAADSAIVEAFVERFSDAPSGEYTPGAEYWDAERGAYVMSFNEVLVALGLEAIRGTPGGVQKELRNHLASLAGVTTQGGTFGVEYRSSIRIKGKVKTKRWVISPGDVV